MVVSPYYYREKNPERAAGEPRKMSVPQTCSPHGRKTDSSRGCAIKSWISWRSLCGTKGPTGAGILYTYLNGDCDQVK